MNRQASGSGEFSQSQLDALQRMLGQQADPSQKLAEFERRIALLERGPVDIQTQSKSFTANEGQHCIVECPPAGLTVTLPRARPQNRNARIALTLRNSNPVRFISVDGLVNSRSSGVMAAPGTFDAISDGSTGWGISVLAAGPTALGPPLAADFVVGVANPGLPNARVATASVEITPSIAVANVISWALNASSVVFAKLQNLTGLSVLGRAANSTGVMAAITAGGAAQYMRSNAAGTSLEFGDPASASIINTAGTLVTAAVTGAVTIAQNGTVAAFGTLAAKSVLANATNATAVPAALSGSASFQHLRVNAANNGLEWSVLTAGDFPANVVPLAGIATIATDTFLGNVSGGTTGPVAVNLSSLAGAGLVFGTHTLDVTAGAGASLVVSANDIQRGALTGAVTASQDSNATAFGAFAAKSVLANATNASAVPSALSGTAQQHLRVNSAGTGLEFALITAPDFTNNTVPITAIQNILTNTVLGRATAGTGAVEDLSVVPPLICAAGNLTMNITSSAHVTVDDFDNIAVNGLGFRKSIHRHFFFDEMLAIALPTVPTTGSILTTADGQWLTQATGAAGSCAVLAGLDDHPGILTFGTGATSGNAITTVKASTLTAVVLVPNDVQEIGILFRLPSLSVDFEFGIADGLITDTNCVIMFINGSGTAHAFTSAAGVSTNTTLSGTVTVNNWFYWQIKKRTTAAGGGFEFFQNEVSIGTATATIPTLGGNLGFALKSTTAGAKTVDIDTFQFETNRMQRF